MQATGEEIKDFYINGWLEGYFHDDWDETLLEKDSDRSFEDVLEDSIYYDLDRFGSVVPGWQKREAGWVSTLTFEEVFNEWNMVTQGPDGYALYAPDRRRVSNWYQQRMGAALAPETLRKENE